MKKFSDKWVSENHQHQYEHNIEYFTKSFPKLQLDFTSPQVFWFHNLVFSFCFIRVIVVSSFIQQWVLENKKHMSTLGHLSKGLDEKVLPSVKSKSYSLNWTSILLVFSHILSHFSIYEIYFSYSTDWDKMQETLIYKRCHLLHARMDITSLAFYIR